MICVSFLFQGIGVLEYWISISKVPTNTPTLVLKPTIRQTGFDLCHADDWRLETAECGLPPAACGLKTAECGLRTEN